MMGLSESGCTATQDTAFTGLPRPKLQANNSNYVWQMEKIVKKTLFDKDDDDFRHTKDIRKS